MTPNPWHALVASATALSERGLLVTMIKTTSTNAPDSWAYGCNGVHIVVGDVDAVVTTDGTEYPLDGGAQ